MYDPKYIEEYGSGPHLAVDAMVVSSKGNIALVMRKDGTYALPGGFVDPGETLVNASKRELYEETGIDVPKHEEPEHMGISDDPKRDRRAHIVSVAYMYQLDDEPSLKMSDEHIGIGWFSMNQIRELKMYSDHKQIIFGMTEGYVSSSIPMVTRSLRDV